MTLPAAVEAIRRHHPTVAALCVEVERLRLEVEDLRRSRMAWALRSDRTEALIESMLDGHREHRNAAKTASGIIYQNGAVNALHLLRERIESTA